MVLRKHQFGDANMTPPTTLSRLNVNGITAKYYLYLNNGFLFVPVSLSLYLDLDGINRIMIVWHLQCRPMIGFRKVHASKQLL